MYTKWKRREIQTRIHVQKFVIYMMGLNMYNTWTTRQPNRRLENKNGFENKDSHNTYQVSILLRA